MEGSTAPDKNVALQRFQESIDKLAKINETATTSLNNNKVFNEKVHGRLVSINEKIKQISEHIKKINDKITLLQGVVDSNKSEGEGNNAEISRLNAEIEKLNAEKKTSMEENNAIIAGLKTEKTEFESTIHQLNTDKDSIQTELDTLKATLEAKGGDDAKHAAAIAAAAEEHQKTLAEINEKLATSQAELTSCKSELEALKTTNAQLLSEHSGNINDIKEEQNKLKAENEGLKAENSSLIAKIIEATTAVLNAQAVIDKIFRDGAGITNTSQNKINLILTDIEVQLETISSAIQGRGAARDGPSQFVETTTKGLRPETTESQPTMIAQPQQTVSGSQISAVDLRRFNGGIQLLKNAMIDNNNKDPKKVKVYKDALILLEKAIKDGDTSNANIILSRPPFLKKGTQIQGGKTRKNTKKNTKNNKTKKQKRQRGGFLVGKSNKRSKISSRRHTRLNKKRRTSKRTTSKRTTSKRTTSY